MLFSNFVLGRNFCCLTPGRKLCVTQKSFTPAWCNMPLSSKRVQVLMRILTFISQMWFINSDICFNQISFRVFNKPFASPIQRFVLISLSCSDNFSRFIFSKLSKTRGCTSFKSAKTQKAMAKRCKKQPFIFLSFTLRPSVCTSFFK